MPSLHRTLRTTIITAIAAISALVWAAVLLPGISPVGAVEAVDHDAPDHEEEAAETEGVPGRDTVIIDIASEKTNLQSQGLALVRADSNAGPCLHVRSDAGMSGGCGFDATDPELSWMSGTETVGAKAVNFVAGVAPEEATIVEVLIGDDLLSAPVTDGTWLLFVQDQQATEVGPSAIKWLNANGEVVLALDR